MACSHTPRHMLTRQRPSHLLNHSSSNGQYKPTSTPRLRTLLAVTPLNSTTMIRSNSILRSARTSVSSGRHSIANRGRQMSQAQAPRHPMRTLGRCDLSLMARITTWLTHTGAVRLTREPTRACGRELSVRVVRQVIFGSPRRRGMRYIRIQSDMLGHQLPPLPISPSYRSVESQRHRTTVKFRSNPASAFVSERSTSWRIPTLCSPLVPCVSLHLS